MSINVHQWLTIPPSAFFAPPRENPLASARATQTRRLSRGRACDTLWAREAFSLMPYSYIIEGRVVHIVWSGVISKEDLQSVGKAMPRLAAELGFAPDVLHTFDTVIGHSFQPLAAYMFSLLRKRVEIPNPVRSAAVATTPEGKSMARMMATLNRNHNLEMKVFASEEAARRWLDRRDEDDD